MEPITSYFDRTRYAMAFFSRLPVAPKSHDGDLASAAITFPIVGLVIGTICGIIWWIASLFLPAIIASGLAIATGMAVTGALHEDGLADTIDGLGSDQDMEKTLKIMRDSQIGTFGSAALVFSIGLRWLALAALAPMAGFFALVIAHGAARAAITIALGTSTYTRNKGAGDAVKKGIGRETMIIILALTACGALLAGSWAGAIAALIGFGAAWLMLSWFTSRLGGYTGDGLGAMEQIAEITVLITLAGFWTAPLA